MKCSLLSQTLILDCCFAGWRTRTQQPNSDLRARSINITGSILEDLDKDILRGRAARVGEGLRFYGNKSHVLLAACGPNETSYEDGNRGVFTKKLLETLLSARTRKLELSNVDVIQRLGLAR